MAIKLKPLYKQVIFMTGATSTIGVATVHMAVEQGAKVFMVDRIDKEEELQRIQNDMRAKGYDTAYAISDEETEQLEFAADQCLKTFGAIDTWINNIGTTPQAAHLKLNKKETKALFEENFWGFVNGCKLATRYLKEKGGALINVGSAVEEAELNTMGVASASRHAIKGFTDTYRKELSQEKIPVSVSLVIPAPIATNMEKEEPTPLTSQDVVAQAILKCAQKPVAEIGVSGMSKRTFPLMEKFLPKIQSYFQKHPNSRDIVTSKKSWMASGALALGGAFLVLKKSRII
ncbi:SDR family NAD(P)-dependent oxidoreductase [Peredibacter sp. HCB2-198]|uniref:SDR family NAD(P)-dependent oxidoreductase n=1 Tax=Peredibacter sp. HCB2-198 TaxID=3383025 RepID=UPI0038B675B1